MPDLFAELNKSTTGQHILDRIEREARLRDGVSQQAEWLAEDGWIIIYTTTRIQGGPHNGKFLCQAFRPVGKGARSGHPSEWEQAYRREFASRKAAKKRAEALYRKHSPKWAARYPEEGS